MSNVTLYELTDRWRALEALADSDELPPDVIRDTLDALEGELQEKATNVAMFIRNLESTADQIDAAAAKMKQRAERLRKRGESLNAYLLLNMQVTGITKIESPWFTLAVRKNPPAVVIDDASQIPEAYLRTPEPAPPPVSAPDKKAIAAAFKDGEDVPGCHIFVGERLEVKV